MLHLDRTEQQRTRNKLMNDGEGKARWSEEETGSRKSFQFLKLAYGKLNVCLTSEWI